MTEVQLKPKLKVGKVPIQHVTISRCAVCGSTERDSYSNVCEQPYPGLDEKGQPYTHIVRRRTACSKCGQARIDRSFENRKT